jgi:hypothetical protein
MDLWMGKTEMVWLVVREGMRPFSTDLEFRGAVSEVG